jgi:uncharacterized BrkB/YihY/UPF0761 family membrane protein
MTQNPPGPNTGRSVLAVLAGFVVVVILSIATDAVFEHYGLFPKPGSGGYLNDRMSATATAYRTLYGIFGSYITARFAPQKPMKHAMIGAAIGMVIGTIGAIAFWNHQPPVGPHWYSVALVVLALPQAWVGAKLAR